MSHRERIGRQIAQIRQERGITQEQLAESTGLQRVNISKIENGRYNVSIDILQKICNSLDCELKIKAAE